MKKCAQCGKKFQPKRATARFCSIPCRQRSYRQRQQETKPQYQLERALLQAIRELRSGQATEALMTVRLAVDDFEFVTQTTKKRPSRDPAKRPTQTKASRRKPHRASPPGPPPKRAQRTRQALALPERRGLKDTPKRRTARAAKAAPPHTQRSPTTRPRAATKPRAQALQDADDLRRRYEHVLESGVVSQAELARELGLPDGTRLSRWRRGGALSPERQRRLTELLERAEWELFVGETLG